MPVISRNICSLVNQKKTTLNKLEAAIVHRTGNSIVILGCVVLQYADLRHSYL